MIPNGHPPQAVAQVTITLFDTGAVQAQAKGVPSLCILNGMMETARHDLVKLFEEKIRQAKTGIEVAPASLLGQ